MNRTIREELEQYEQDYLSPYASKSAEKMCIRDSLVGALAEVKRRFQKKGTWMQVPEYLSPHVVVRLVMPSMR